MRTHPSAAVRDTLFPSPLGWGVKGVRPTLGPHGPYRTRPRDFHAMLLQIGHNAGWSGSSTIGRPEEATVSETLTTPRRVLVADDNPPVLDALSGLLGRWGYDVILARDGVEAWKVLQ